MVDPESQEHCVCVEGTHTGQDYSPNTHTFTLFRGTLELPVESFCTALGGAGNPENPEETQTDTRKTCKTPHRGQPELRIEPGILEK